VARSCLEARGGRATILVQGRVARTCLSARCDHAKWLVGCVVFVDEKFVEGFGGGLCLAVLWCSLRSRRGIFVGRNQV